LQGAPPAPHCAKAKRTSERSEARPTGRRAAWRGTSFIKGGRAHLRQALYMPALVATRFNKPLKTKYQALITAGKPPKVAITAIMRKLIVLANALLRDNRTWANNAP